MAGNEDEYTITDRRVCEGKFSYKVRCEDHSTWCGLNDMDMDPGILWLAREYDVQARRANPEHSRPSRSRSEPRDMKPTIEALFKDDGDKKSASPRKRTRSASPSGTRTTTRRIEPIDIENPLIDSDLTHFTLLDMMYEDDNSRPERYCARFPVGGLEVSVPDLDLNDASTHKGSVVARLVCSRHADLTGENRNNMIKRIDSQETEIKRMKKMNAKLFKLMRFFAKEKKKQDRLVPPESRSIDLTNVPYLSEYCELRSAYSQIFETLRPFFPKMEEKIGGMGKRKRDE